MLSVFCIITNAWFSSNFTRIEAYTYYNNISGFLIDETGLKFIILGDSAFDFSTFKCKILPKESLSSLKEMIKQLDRDSKKFKTLDYGDLEIKVRIPRQQDDTGSIGFHGGLLLIWVYEGDNITVYALMVKPATGPFASILDFVHINDGQVFAEDNLPKIFDSIPAYVMALSISKEINAAKK